MVHVQPSVPMVRIFNITCRSCATRTHSNSVLHSTCDFNPIDSKPSMMIHRASGGECLRLACVREGT